MRHLILLLLSGCGMVNPDHIFSTNNSPPQIRSIDPVLLDAVKSFEELSNIKVGYPIVVGVLDASKAGLCESWTNGAHKITISQNYIAKATQAQIEQVVWHELGHCSLDRQHNDSVISFSWNKGISFPNSVMNTYAFGEFNMIAFRRERKHYEDELIGK